MDEMLKLVIVLGGIAILVTEFFIGLGWIALILSMFWGVFALHISPREQQLQSIGY